jgi:hypothetical protein
MKPKVRQILDHGGRKAACEAHYRMYVAAIGTTAITRHGGYGLTLDAVIDSEQETYGHMHANFEAEKENGVRPPTDTAADWSRTVGDVAVWEGDRILAVLRPDPAGAPRYRVHRLDKP